MAKREPGGWVEGVDCFADEITCPYCLEGKSRLFQAWSECHQFEKLDDAKRHLWALDEERARKGEKG